MINPADIIHLSSRAFWDIDMSKLDYEKQADYIIRKVFDYGSWEDILEVVSYFNKDKVINALTTAPYLMEKTYVFASKLFTIPISEFQCSTTRQLHPIS
jgi:hypothetical protein